MPANIWPSDLAVQLRVPVADDDPPKSKRPNRKKRAGQGSRARRKKATDSGHSSPSHGHQQPEAEPQSTSDRSWQTSASRPAPLSLSRRSSIDDGADILSTRAQQVLFAFLNEGEDGDGVDEEAELWGPTQVLPSPDSDSATRLRSRRPSAAEWQAVMDGKVPQRCLEEVFAGGVLALPLPTSPTSRTSRTRTSAGSFESYYGFSSSDTDNPKEQKYTESSNVSMHSMNPSGSRMRSRRSSASDWLEKHRKTTAEPPGFGSSSTSSVDAAAITGASISVDEVTRHNTQRMSIESCSRNELQDLINERLKNRRKSVCAEETAQFLTKNAKPTRFTTKWALPSAQRVMFNGSAQNIPPTPAPVSSSGVTPSSSPTQDRPWGEPRTVRRGSITDRMLESSGAFEPLRTPSGTSVMFPAQVYDAVFSK